MNNILDEIEIRLRASSAIPVTVQDMIFTWLGDKGYVGTLGQRLGEWGHDNGLGISRVSLVATVPNPPTAVLAIKGDGEATVSWSPSYAGGSAITGYYVTTTPGGVITQADPDATSVVVPNLDNGESYTFTVRARNAVGYSQHSVPSNATVPSGVPGIPSIFSVSQSPSSATITITAPESDGGSPITGYTVTSDPEGITATGFSPVLVTGLTDGVQYTFTAVAINSNGTSAASDPSGAIVAADVPGAPTAVVATPGNTTISVAFTAPDDGGAAISLYTVTAFPDDGTTTSLTATNSVSPVLLTGLTNGQSYSLSVTATNSAGTGPASSIVQAIPAAVPFAPEITGVTAGNAQVSVAFEVVDGGSPITDCLVTSSPGGLTGSGAASPIIVSGLTNGTAYTFTMTATNAVGTSTASDPSASVTPATVPGAPTIGTAVAGDALATVPFTAPADNGGAAITLYTATASPGGKTGTGTSSPIQVFDLANGVAYTFTVTATNVMGTSAASAASNSVTPTTSATVPGAPIIGTATRTGSGQVSVAFDPPLNTGGSAITAYTATSTPGSITGTAASSPITVSGLTDGVSYTFKVYATNASGNGPESAASNAVTPAAVPSATGVPFVTTSSSGTATILLGFPASDGGSPITSFTFTASPGGATLTETYASVNANPVTFTGLTNGTTYSFTAHATNIYGDGPESLPSNEVTPASGSGASGPFDSLYDPAWVPDESMTFNTRPTLSQPAKSSGGVSYTEARHNTKIYRVASMTDAPYSTTSHMKPEYSTMCIWNCDNTRFTLVNSHGYHYIYNASDFSVINAGSGGGFSVSAGAVGTGTIYPKDPSDWAWHATDPDKYIFKNPTGLIFYEYNVVTRAITRTIDFTSRIRAVFGSSANDMMSGGGGCASIDARYWGLSVKSTTGANLGYVTLDMVNDEVTGTMLSSVSHNNCIMSNFGNWIIVSHGDSSLTWEGAKASSTPQGERAYSRDFSTWKQVNMDTTHGAPVVDYLGQEAYLSKTEGASFLPNNYLYYIVLGDASEPVALKNFGDADGSAQWSQHMSGWRAGWCLLTSYDAPERPRSKALDDMVYMVEIKPSPRILRLMDTRTTRYTYRQEPHGTISRDGLRIVLGVSWDNTSSSNVTLGYMVGLPSWTYGDSGSGGGVLSYGSNLLDNGSFTGSLDSWTVSTGTWAYNSSGGTAQVSAPSSSLMQPVSLVVGTTYRVTYDVFGYSATGSGVRARFGGTTPVNGALHTTDGPKTDYLVAVTGNNEFRLDSAADFSGTARINNVVLVMDNMLTNGDFSSGSTGWSVTSGLTISGGESVWVPDAASKDLEQSVTTIAGVTYRLTFDVSGWVNNGSGHTITASFRDGGATSESGVFEFGDGTKTIEWVSNGNTLLRIRGGLNFEATVDNIKLVALP